MTNAYQHSNTPVAKSQEDIRRILLKYKASGVQFSEDWEKRMLLIRFIYPIAGNPHIVLFKVPIPKADSLTPSGRRRKASALQILQAQHERGVWRAVYWAIKSRMEAVEFGIETFEEAFLSHFEVPGTNKQVGEFIIPKLHKGELKFLQWPIRSACCDA